MIQWNGGGLCDECNLPVRLVHRFEGGKEPDGFVSHSAVMGPLGFSVVGVDVLLTDEYVAAALAHEGVELPDEVVERISNDLRARLTQVEVGE